MPSEKELVESGWKKQTTLDEPRLSEMIELYKEIGFEVRLEPFDPGDDPNCTECMLRSPQQFRTIFTRKK